MASVYKRGRVWWGRVERDSNVHRQSLRTGDKRVAEKRLNQWIESLRAQAWGEKPSRTYKEMVVSFHSEHLPTLTPSSQRRYKTSLKNLDRAFSDKCLTEITGASMSDFEQARRRDGVSNPTIRRDLACLSSMFSHVIIDKEWTDTNPVTLFMQRQARRGRLKEAPPRTRYLSHDEEARLLGACLGDLGEMVAFAIDTGLRLEEQLSLTWPQVDMKRERITVTGKGGKTRQVPLLPRAMKILSKRPRHLRYGVSKDWVFCNKSGERYGKRTRGLAGALRRANKALLEEAPDATPIKHLQWHDLRRTCGCRLLQDHENMSMDKIRDWLGHSSVKVTERTYAFLRIDNLQDAVTKTGTGRADSQKSKAKKRRKTGARGRT